MSRMKMPCLGRAYDGKAASYCIHLGFVLFVLPGYFLQLRGTLRYYNSYWAPLCKHTHTHTHTKSVISPFDLKK